MSARSTRYLRSSTDNRPAWRDLKDMEPDAPSGVPVALLVCVVLFFTGVALFAPDAWYETALRFWGVIQ